MNRLGEAGVALGVAVVLGGAIGWLLTGSDNASVPSQITTSNPASGSVLSAPPSLASGLPSSVGTTPTGSSGGVTRSLTQSSADSSDSDSDAVSAGAVTVTAAPSSAKPYEAIEISGTVEGATPGTTLEFARKDGDTLATTQVGRAGAYRLTVKLGRSGTFVVRAVDGTTVLATSEPFALTVT